MSLRKYRNDQLKDGIVNVAQSISSWAELALVGDTLSAGLFWTKFALSISFTFLSLANTGTSILTNEHLKKMAELLNVLIAMEEEVNKIGDTVEKLEMFSAQLDADDPDEFARQFWTNKDMEEFLKKIINYET